MGQLGFNSSALNFIHVRPQWSRNRQVVADISKHCVYVYWPFVYSQIDSTEWAANPDDWTEVRRLQSFVCMFRNRDSRVFDFCLSLITTPCNVSHVRRASGNVLQHEGTNYTSTDICLQIWSISQERLSSQHANRAVYCSNSCLRLPCVRLKSASWTMNGMAVQIRAFCDWCIRGIVWSWHVAAATTCTCLHEL